MPFSLLSYFENTYLSWYKNLTTQHSRRTCTDQQTQHTTDAHFGFRDATIHPFLRGLLLSHCALRRNTHLIVSTRRKLLHFVPATRDCLAAIELFFLHTRRRAAANDLAAGYPYHFPCSCRQNQVAGLSRQIPCGMPELMISTFPGEWSSVTGCLPCSTQYDKSFPPQIYDS